MPHANQYEKIFLLSDEVKHLALSISPELAGILLESFKAQLQCFAHLEKRLNQIDLGQQQPGRPLDAPPPSLNGSASFFNIPPVDQEVLNLDDPTNFQNTETFSNGGYLASFQSLPNPSRFEESEFIDPLLIQPNEDENNIPG
jgi:hypothetical protein